MQASECWQPEYEPLVVAIAGDLGKPFLGLSPETYSNLAMSIGSIYHVAASVSGLIPYASARAANVNGTVEMIRLCKTMRDKTLHHVSSAAVFNCYPAGLVMKEDHPLNDVPEMLNMDGYSKSKWVADRLVMHARAHHGVRATIYRPGFISCHSVTGVGNKEDFDTRLFASIFMTRSAPVDIPDRAKLDMTPVDFVSRSIVHLGMKWQGPATCFQFMNPNGSMTINQILKVIRRIHRQPINRSHSRMERPEIENTRQRIAKIPYSEWFAQLQGVGPENPIYPLLNTFSKNQFPSREGLRCDCTNTIDALGAIGTIGMDRAFPKIEEDNIVRHVEWMHRARLIPGN